MNPCPQCGAIPQPSDKFCNICGASVAASFGSSPGGAFPPPQGFGPPPVPYGAAPAPLRCQAGHEIAPGASYCAQGHPIALEAMPFAHDPYGGGYAQPPAPPPLQPQAPTGYAPNAPPAHGGYGAFPDPNAPYGGYNPDPNAAFGAPPPHQGFGVPPGYPGAPPVHSGFGPPQGPQPGYPSGPPDFAGGAPAPVAAPLNLPPNALRGFLISYQTNAQGDFWPLHGGRKTIGRANSGEQVDIPLTDATISSRHAAMIVDAAAGTVHVEDTASTNGTFVNEEHIGFNGKRELRDGDKVRFGGYSTLVKVVYRL